MPTYIAFLRAINVGKRMFAKGAIIQACEDAGFTDVETYINTGNVRVTTRLRSRAKVETALEEAFAASAGFDVPTIVFTPRGRAAHLLLGDDYHSAKLSNAVVEKHLGTATNRNVKVIRTLAEKWGEAG